MGVGCFTLVVGFFSGAMIATLVGKFLAFLTREPQCSGVPMCDWYVWFYTGGALGALSLTVFIQTRLARPSSASIRLTELIISARESTSVPSRSNSKH